MKGTPHPGYPRSHHLSFSHLTGEQKTHFMFPIVLFQNMVEHRNRISRILPNNENTCRGSKLSDYSRLSESKQHGRTLSGQSRTWPKWLHPGLEHPPEGGQMIRFHTCIIPLTFGSISYENIFFCSNKIFIYLNFNI